MSDDIAYEDLTSLLGDRYVQPAGWGIRYSDFAGETRAYASMDSSDTKRVYHADPDCPYFPLGSVHVYRMSVCREAYYLTNCSYCTTEEQ